MILSLISLWYALINERTPALETNDLLSLKFCRGCYDFYGYMFLYSLEEDCMGDLMDQACAHYFFF